MPKKWQKENYVYIVISSVVVELTGFHTPGDFLMSCMLLHTAVTSTRGFAKKI